MNKQIIAIVLLLTVLSMGCVNPMTSVEGRYVSEVNPDAYLELKDGGQFVVNQDRAFSGDYTVDGNTITLIYMFGSFVVTLDGDIITDEDGERWVKESCI